jgi:hypothetical protein
MLQSLRRRVAALASLLLLAFSAAATSTGVDYTDQWWGGQSEHGWGVNFIEQGTTIFATLFVYGTDQTPRWYVATMLTTGTTSFSGDLYSTTGPYYGAGSFDGNAVVATKVGSMSVAFNSPYSGAMTYVVNGTTVNKSILRQSFANNNIAGNYVGGLNAQGFNCHGTSNGPIFASNAVVFTQTNQAVSMVVNFYNPGGLLTTCTFNGTLTTQGVLAQIVNGSWGCSANNQAVNAGTFNMDAISMTQSGFSGLFTGADQFCSYNGYFGGIKAVQ